MNKKAVRNFVLFSLLMLVTSGLNVQGSIFERDLLPDGRIPPWSYINVDGRVWINFYQQPWSSFDNAVKTWHRADYRTSAEYILLSSKMIRVIAAENQMADEDQLSTYADRLDLLAELVYLHRVEVAEQLLDVFTEGAQLLTRHYFYTAVTSYSNGEGLTTAYALKATLLSANSTGIFSGYEFDPETAMLFYRADNLINTAISVQWWQERDMQQAMSLMIEALQMQTNNQFQNAVIYNE